ncbi:hypothetical protein PG989_016103 [Apiospora arundinis]|uniref:MFS general substrate transporter n=1 Tax=Apiospora arundinis TaxID=335852 RepID=A0ABR2JHC2_9PEZI
MAYQDTHVNTFVSGIPNVPHRWLGFIHGCYALGCFVGPLIATGPGQHTCHDGSGRGLEDGVFRLDRHR